MSPQIAFEHQNVGLPGIGYGEFALSAKASAIPFKCSIFSLEPGCSTPLDNHSVEECWLVLSGVGRLTYDGEPFVVKRHSLWFFESEKNHFVENIGTDPLVIYSSWWPATPLDSEPGDGR